MAFLRRIVTLGRRSRMEREIEAELQEHMQMCIDDNMAEGMSREQAERDARVRFGSPLRRASVCGLRMRRWDSRAWFATCERRCADL